MKPLGKWWAIALGQAALATSAGAFDIPTHMDLTRQALERVRVTIAGEEIRFSARAIEEICRANEDTDSVWQGNAALYHPEWHFTNESFGASSQHLIDSRTNIGTQLQGDTPQPATARATLGRALHTVQDFYSHSNWVELGNAAPGGINTSLGRSRMTNPAASFHPCPGAADTLGAGGGGGLTSAYFLGRCGCSDRPTGKCFHGNYGNTFCGVTTCEADGQNGINKDIPARTGHATARTLGFSATIDYLNQVLEDLRGDDAALLLLLDARGSVGFVVDTTGSMSEEIAGVRSTISSLIGILSANPTEKPTNWILVPFNDPGVGPAFVTRDASVMQSRIGTLFASGGGDCPELSQGGLLQAVDRALPYSRLYLYTDASAKDAGLANPVIRRAQEKKIRISSLLSGSCSPIDPVYFRATEETGGQMLIVSPTQITNTAPLLRPGLAGDLQTILLRKINLAGAGVERVPIDTTVRRVQFSITRPAGGTILLRDPAGAEVTSASPGTQVAVLGDAVIYTIDTPAPGLWQVSMNGLGQFTVGVSGNSPLEFWNAQFVRENITEPEGIHGGLSPIDGLPLAGSSALAEITLIGAPANTTFDIADQFGVVLDSPKLSQGHIFAQAEHFVGTVDMPANAFRFIAHGVESGGIEFRREFPVLFLPQTVSVQVTPPDSATIRDGESKTLSFLVRNIGPGGQFSMQAVDGIGFVASVSPPSAFLATGASLEVRVVESVPAGTPAGTPILLSFTASRFDNSAVFNSATIQLTVVGAPRCTVVCPEDRVVSVWPPNHSMAEFDLARLLAIEDDAGRPATIEITAITQDEPVNALDGSRGGSAGRADAEGLGGSLLRVRSERLGQGNGRVYVATYTARCVDGGECSGRFIVHVPHDKAHAAVDDGQAYDSTDADGSADVDGDGLVTGEDLMIVVDLMGVVAPSSSQYFPRADTDRDGVVDELDVARVISEL